MKAADGIHLKELFKGNFSAMFWLAQGAGLVLPIVLLLFSYFRRPLPISIISFVVLISAWLKRYIIVIPTLEHPFLPVQNVPQNFHDYAPTSIEVMITIFSFVSALLIISILAKLFPVITIWEYAEEQGIDKKYLSEKPKN